MPSCYPSPLYNGNIAAMAVNLAKINKPLVYSYHYDQLNRLVNMDAYTGLTNSGFTLPGTAPTAYKEEVTYDPNGNIMTYKRNGDAARLSMDDMTYSYKPLTNQLDRVVDAAPDAAAGDYDKYRDIKQGQTTGNYTYDAIGNLTSDVSEGLTGINWSVYGKILSIMKNGNTIAYSYDASGNRISKTANGTTTVYVRDASGNVMSIYEKTASTVLKQTELHLYGSSRIGILKEQTVAPIPISLAAGYDAATESVYTRNEKSFELSNHLGNVLVTVSDKKVGLDANTDGAVDYYTADVSSVQDYYPFGMMMPGRQYGALGRYGFNGKETDNEVKGDGNQQDYGMRIYDLRLGRFLSIDPISKKYPWYTPYQFAGNKPIVAIDVDGLEDQWTATGKHVEGPYLKHPTTGEILYSHPPTPDNPIVTYSRGSAFAKEANPSYQYVSWNGMPFSSSLEPSTRTNAVFKWGFSEYLPKRFIDHYELAKGQTYTMNRQEMKDVNMVPIGIQGNTAAENKTFTNNLNGLKVGESTTVSLSVLTGGNTSGTLGNFYATFDGVLTRFADVNGSSTWTFKGTIQMNDYWDFDADASNKKRPPLAEKLVRFANKHLKGTPFNITSMHIPVSQNSSQLITDYNEGKSELIPNRVAKTAKDASN